MTGNMDIIDAATIQPQLTQPLELQVFPELTSTNQVAKQWLMQGQKTPDVLIADHQTAGYGRLDRQFYSPAGTGIYMTFIWPEMVIDESIGLLTPMMAVAVREAIVAVCQVNPTIKWVNDLYLNHNKVVGILAESIPGHGVVMGVGIDFKSDATRQQFAAQSGSLLPANTSVTRVQLIAAIINRVTQMLPTYHTGDYLSAYRAHSMLIGQTVTLKVGADEQIVKVIGIGQAAELVVQQTDGQQKSYTSAEVTRVLNWTE